MFAALVTTCYTFIICPNEILNPPCVEAWIII